MAEMVLGDQEAPLVLAEQAAARKDKTQQMIYTGALIFKSKFIFYQGIIQEFLFAQ